MRFKRALAVGALLVMSASMAACGSDDKAGGDGDGKASSTGGGAGGHTGGLPSASSMADIAGYLNHYGSCLDLELASDYDDSVTADRDPSWDIPDDRGPAAWGVKERAVCRDNYDDTSTLLLVDMKKFQTELKKGAPAEGFLIGMDFAVVPGGDETIRDLKASDLKYMTCDPEFEMPSGYKSEPALVDGCVLTDYFPAHI